MIDQRIIYACNGMACLLQSPAVIDASPRIRKELADILRQTATMIETQEFQVDAIKRAKAFAETMRKITDLHD